MTEECGLEYSFTVRIDDREQEVTRRCSQPAFKQGRCIAHLDDPSKDIGSMRDAVKDAAAQTDRYLDLCHYVFPKDTFTFPVAIRKPMVFCNCVFYGDASFHKQGFPQYVSFRDCIFHANADFSHGGDPNEAGAHFEHVADFSGVSFHKNADFGRASFRLPPVFRGTHFHGHLNLGGAVFRDTSKKPVLEFVDCKIETDSDFGLALSDEHLALRFADCDLSGLRVSSLPMRKKNVSIDFDVGSQWYLKRRFYHWRRSKIRDEDLPDVNPITVIDCYSYLEKYYYERSNYNLARHFYVGQMVSMRRDPNLDSPSRFLNWLYKLVSNYGESILRPICCLALTLIVFPCFLLLAGTKVHRDTSKGEEIVQVNYDCEFDLDNMDVDQLWADYLSAFGANLSLSTFDRKHELSPPSDSLQKGMLVAETVLNVVFASLFVVAARRKFTPKKPTGS